MGSSNAVTVRFPSDVLCRLTFAIASLIVSFRLRETIKLRDFHGNTMVNQEGDDMI